MGVNIDKSRCDNVATGVNSFIGLARRIAYSGEQSVADADITMKLRLAGTVDDRM